MAVSIPGSRWGTLIFSYIHRFGILFWVQNSSKMNIFEVMKKLWIFLGGWGVEVSTKLDYFGGSFLYILGLFKVKIQNGNIFGTAKFQVFFGYA